MLMLACVPAPHTPTRERAAEVAETKRAFFLGMLAQPATCAVAELRSLHLAAPAGSACSSAVAGGLSKSKRMSSDVQNRPFYWSGAT